MEHTLEIASTGRAKCRACGGAIAKGTARLGFRQPSPYNDGDMTLWFHPRCGAYKRPEALLAALEGDAGAAHEDLAPLARAGLVHERLVRLERAERAPSGQARCRQCRNLVAKGVWRARLTFFEESGRFNPGGFVHLACVRAYCDLPGDADAEPVAARLLHFTPDASPEDVAAIHSALTTSPTD